MQERLFSGIEFISWKHSYEFQLYRYVPSGFPSHLQSKNNANQNPKNMRSSAYDQASHVLVGEGSGSKKDKTWEIGVLSLDEAALQELS